MWWQIIKSDDIEIHVDDLITDELQERAEQLGVDNLDIRMKDRLVGAGIPIGNDGIISVNEFFEWLEENPEYLSNMTESFQSQLRRFYGEGGRRHRNFRRRFSTLEGTRFEDSIRCLVEEALHTIIEIEDAAIPQLEGRELFTMGRGQQYWRNVALNPESSQRHVPEEEET